MNLSNLDFQQQARQYLQEEKYNLAAGLYEEAISREPEVKSHYWHFGLMLLLQGQEVEAQTTWLFGMAEGEAEKVEIWTKELLEVLETEAKRQESLSNYSNAWAIRQHLREIDDSDINNLLQIILLSVKLEIYTGEELNDFQIIQLLNSNNLEDLNRDLLMYVVEQILNYAPDSPQSLELASACFSYITDKNKFKQLLWLTSNKLVSSELNKPRQAAKFLELSLGLESEKYWIFHCLTIYYRMADDYSEAIEAAKKCYWLSDELSKKVFASHLILQALMSVRGYWQETKVALKEHESLLGSFLAKSPPDNLDEKTTVSLFSTTFFFPYVRDEAKLHSYFRNQIAKICQTNIKKYAKNKIAKYQSKQSPNKQNRRLKIGYISTYLKQHSVGWLVRWLLQYHDREKFGIFIYYVNFQEAKNDPLQNWYLNQTEKTYQFDGEAKSTDIADRIYEEKIDILVDLDSITWNLVPVVMTLKAAPVQATWLGWDASGVSEIDYFIADPYVLPENAQDYYKEKIWRLPQTYIAVDGFEVGVPTLRRDRLHIPNDAIVYLTSQKHDKYNAEMLKLQFKIITEVPNSYFLIKNTTEEKFVEEFIIELAKEEGVSKERLVFLSLAPTSAIHRANLAIADVVLDTYPYNGATTTMETLWMCVPMVTRAGEQFASRNSYTMMVNAGITEGIAWTEEEYVEWGIRLGKDEKLRQEISWKLRKSRQTAPLWNGKQFAREMEKAYEGMWQRYIEGES